MNFLAHAEIARRRAGDDPGFVLGAVLPDLLPMAGLRLDRSEVPDDVAAGWHDHHRADAAFHASPAFGDGVAALRTDLRRTDLDKGPRRAVAHVGWELLFDDAVASDVALIQLFRRALDRGRTLTDDPRWQRLLDRFALVRATGPSDILLLTQRVQRACARRPRLAFDDAHLVPVSVVLGEHHHHVLTVAPGVLDEVARATG